MEQASVKQHAHGNRAGPGWLIAASRYPKMNRRAGACGNLEHVITRKNQGDAGKKRKKTHDRHQSLLGMIFLGTQMGTS